MSMGTPSSALSPRGARWALAFVLMQVPAALLLAAESAGGGFLGSMPLDAPSILNLWLWGLVLYGVPAAVAGALLAALVTAPVWGIAWYLRRADPIARVRARRAVSRIAVAGGVVSLSLSLFLVVLFYLAAWETPPYRQGLGFIGLRPDTTAEVAPGDQLTLINGVSLTSPQGWTGWVITRGDRTGGEVQWLAIGPRESDLMEHYVSAQVFATEAEMRTEADSFWKGSESFASVPEGMARTRLLARMASPPAASQLQVLVIPANALPTLITAEPARPLESASSSSTAAEACVDLLLRLRVRQRDLAE